MSDEFYWLNQKQWIKKKQTNSFRAPENHSKLYPGV